MTKIRPKRETGKMLSSVEMVISFVFGIEVICFFHFISFPHTVFSSNFRKIELKVLYKKALGINPSAFFVCF
ncbi:hypothetical protein F5ESL0236_00515 [Lactobacillus sp. ESL0236]|nr:hypothetical protein F5ESL0236_00515 [Lactobacillus sp. ESL0236]